MSDYINFACEELRALVIEEPPMGMREPASDALIASWKEDARQEERKRCVSILKRLGREVRAGEWIAADWAREQAEEIMVEAIARVRGDR